MKNPVVKKKKNFNQFMSLRGSCRDYPAEEHTSNNRLAIPASRHFKNTGVRIVRNL